MKTNIRPEDYDIPKIRRRIEDYLRKCNPYIVLHIASYLKIKWAKKEGGK